MQSILLLLIFLIVTTYNEDAISMRQREFPPVPQDADHRPSRVLVLLHGVSPCFTLC